MRRGNSKQIMYVAVDYSVYAIHFRSRVCYQRRSYRSGYTYYRRRYYSYSYRCGWWGWRRCRRQVTSFLARKMATKNTFGVAQKVN